MSPHVTKSLVDYLWRATDFGIQAATQNNLQFMQGQHDMLVHITTLFLEQENIEMSPQEYGASVKYQKVEHDG